MIFRRISYQLSMERSTVMLKFIICLALVSVSLAAPAPASDIKTDNSNILEKSESGIIGNVKAAQSVRNSEGLIKATTGITLENSPEEKAQIQKSSYPFILEEPHLNNALISSISILKELNPDSDFKVNLNEPKSKTSSTIHIINHIHSGAHSGNDTKQESKEYVDKFLNNSFDSILSKAVSSTKDTKWENGERKSKRINPTRTLSGAKNTEECSNTTLSATDNSDKISDQKKHTEDKPQNNLNTDSSVKSQANVKNSNKDATGQTLLSFNDTSVSDELTNSRRKAKVLDNGRLGTESESASAQAQPQPGHDVPAASQGRVESLSSHVGRDSTNQPLESDESPRGKSSSINKEDDKIQPVVSTNNVLTKEKPLGNEDKNDVNKNKLEGGAILNNSQITDKKSLNKDPNISLPANKISSPSETFNNAQIDVTSGSKKNIEIDSLQSGLQRGLIAINVFQKLSELNDISENTKNDNAITDGKSISKDKKIISPQSTSTVEPKSEIPKNLVIQDIEKTSKPSGTSVPKVENQLKLGESIPDNKQVDIPSKVKVVLKTDSKYIDDKKSNDKLSSSRGGSKFDNKYLPLSDHSKAGGTENTENNGLRSTAQPTAHQVTTPATESHTEKSLLVKKVESSTTSAPSSSTPKTYQESNNFRQSTNIGQNKRDESDKLLNIQAKAEEDKANNTYLEESTINPVTPRQGRGQVTKTPTVQWIKITPPTKNNNDENLEVQEANYLSRAAKNQFQSNNNYPFNSFNKDNDKSVSDSNAGAEKLSEESKFVKIIPTTDREQTSAIPKLPQTYESFTESPRSYSSPLYIERENYPKGFVRTDVINEKESYSTPGPFGYSTANSIDVNNYSRNPTQKSVENHHQPSIILNPAQLDSFGDSLISTNVNRGSYENQKTHNSQARGNIYSSSDNGNIGQSRDAYKNLQEISLDSPKDQQFPKERVNGLIETVSEGYRNANRRVNPNAARNNNSFENVSPSNEPVTRGVNKYKTNRFETISAFTTDSQINKLYTENSPTTKSQYNPITQRPRSRVAYSTVSSQLSEEKSILDRRHEEKVVAALKVSDAKESPKGKYAIRTSRGNIKYVKNPHSGDWVGDGDEKYPPQFSYNYKTATGISAYQKGVLTEINDRKVFVIHGSYNYTAPDGTPIVMTYTADELGFHPQQTVSIDPKNKLDGPTESKDFNKELNKRKAKMVRKAQHSERTNSTEASADSEEEKPAKPSSQSAHSVEVEETTKLTQNLNIFARGRGKNIYREGNNSGDTNVAVAREVRTVEAGTDNKAPQRISRRRNSNPTVPVEIA